MKYILVNGGVISGIGKGVIASSIGTLLKAEGFNVTSIKIDPYINIDAGTFSPTEHGEVYVLDDGGEVDLDLGNYERFLDICLNKANNITTGKVYAEVIKKERRGDYLGKTVQVVPHICNEILEQVESVAKVPVSSINGIPVVPEICIIELGGTIGDIESMPFVEAFRQFQFRVGATNFCSVHVSLVPEPKSTGEQKTKPTQNSVKDCRAQGLAPDLIVCRSENPINQEVKEKVSHFCHVPPKQVICMHDVPSIYQVPIALQNQGVVQFFCQKLQLEPKEDLNSSRGMMEKWKKLADRFESATKEVKIALVGKYTSLEDSYASVVKALKHSCLYAHYSLKLMLIKSEDLELPTERINPVQYHESWQQLCGADGIIVPGGFGHRGTDGMILAIQWARTHKKPFLGICLGLQVAVIEFARNVMGWDGAHSTEMDPNTKYPVVVDMPEHNTGDKGGTMRLGKRVTLFKEKDSIIYKLYGSVDSIEERHRHRYEVNPDMVQKLEENGLRFVAKDESGQRMEIIDIKDHPYFVAVQFHPEYLSRPLKPSPPFLGFILASIGIPRLDHHLNHEIRNGSPRSQMSEIDSESSDH